MTTYKSSPFASQHPWDHVDGAPFGTRGGIVAKHVFPADGMYQFRMVIEGGVGTHLEDIDISIDGKSVSLFHYEKGVDRTAASADAPLGADLYTSEPIAVKAGQQRVSAAFVRRTDGPYEDLIKPHDWSMASNGNASAGTTTPPHVMELAVIGPSKITGISETQSRQDDLLVPSVEVARRGRLRRADRRPVRHARVSSSAHEARSRRPDGVLHAGREGRRVRGGRSHRRSRRSSRARTSCSGSSRCRRTSRRGRTTRSATSTSRRGCRSSSGAASRMTSCSSSPQQKKLSEPKTLDREVQRMLADPKSEALATRFAAQWLRLQDLDKVHPDAFLFPDYDQQLADDMRRETELFFEDIVRNDRSILDFFNGELHVRERAARSALRHSERLRPGVPPRGVSGQHAPRDPRPGQHPRADVDREPHVAGAARQVGHGSADRTCRRRRRRRTFRRSRKPRTARTASRSRRASGWRSTARTRRARRATSTWTRSVSRSTTST